MTRRKSTRNATKKATPEKPPVKRTRRQSRRNKRSSSVSSEASDDEPLKSMQNTESTADETQSTITDADSDDDSVPLAELEVRRNSRRQTKVVTLKGENANSRPRRGRSQGSPVVKDTVQEDDINEEIEENKGERKGKGKSKSKNKSKTEQASSCEPEIQTNHDVSENVQVTTQSPTKPVDNEHFESDYVTVQCVTQCESNRIDESGIKSEENDAQITENSTNVVSNQETVIVENENKQTEQERESEPVQINNDHPNDSMDKKDAEIVQENETNTKYVQERSFIENEIADSPKDYEKDDSNIEEKSNEDADSQSETNTVPETENVEEKSVKSPERKHRNSSISITIKDDKEVERPKISKKIKLNRNFSMEAKEQIEQQRTPEKKFQWDSSDVLTNIIGPVQKVDVVTLKTVCPTLEFLSENEVKLEDVPMERKNSVNETEIRLNRLSSTDNEESERQEVAEKSNSNSENNEGEENTTNIIAINRKISIVDDTASKLRPPPSPAKNPLSDVLFITNLVRPFTLKQLKELLQRTGNIKEDGFWTDRIKSKCYVQYESQEEAEATRNALHGVHWPIGNGKKLVIEYASVEDLETAKNPPPPPAVAVVEVQEKTVEKENKEPERRVSEGEHKEVHEREEKRKRSDGHVREWDVGKEDMHRRRSRSRERGRKNRRSASPRDDFISKKQRKEEDAVPQKLMDDLFLKTKATPSIYWQPLSPEEIATKQQQRLIRMEEHKRRMEESSRVRDRSRRGGSFRRR